MIRIVTLLFFIVGCISFSTAQHCPLPTIAEIERELNRLLPSELPGEGEGGITFNSNVTEGSVQYVCQAQGDTINTYEFVSLIATYTYNDTSGEHLHETSIFQMECTSGKWSGDATDSTPLKTPPPSVVGAPVNTNCFSCRDGFGRDDRCRGILFYQSMKLF